MYNVCSVDIASNMTVSSVSKYLLCTSSVQSFSFICCWIYRTLSQAVLPVLFPVIQFDILSDLQYVQSSDASYPLYKSFSLIYCQIYSMFSQAMLLLLFTNRSV
jgi:hypothetical protein